GVTYRRAIRLLAAHLGCEPTEQAVYARRLDSDPGDYAASLLRATGTELLLVDDGYPPAREGTTWKELGELAGCPSRPFLPTERLEPEAGRGEAASARPRGFAGLKTSAA